MHVSSKRERRAAILMYHRVSEDGADRQMLCVPPQEFEAQMLHLKRTGYDILPVDVFGDAVRRGDIPDRGVALTFDDGYLDSLRCAAPILAALSLPATFFVITDAMTGQQELWWDALERALSTPTLAKGLTIRFPAEVVELPQITTARERWAARDLLRNRLYALTREARERTIQEILDRSGAGGPPRGAGRSMTVQEVRELARIPGMTVGSHTQSHPMLPFQPSEVKALELLQSRLVLERVLARPVKVLSYPYGRVDAETMILARAAGYAVAVATGNRSVSSSSDPFALPRYAVRSGDDFAQCLERMLACA
jgi:peptidoglycan/xylan/chitin deacetylase (PgdA/CDA1 family)